MRKKEEEKYPIQKLVFAIMFAIIGVICIAVGAAGGAGEEPATLFAVGLFAIVIAPIWYFYGSIDYSKWS